MYKSVDILIDKNTQGGKNINSMDKELDNFANLLGRLMEKYAGQLDIESLPVPERPLNN